MFTARYESSPYITQIRFVFKGLRELRDIPPLPPTSPRRGVSKRRRISFHTAVRLYVINSYATRGALIMLYLGSRRSWVDSFTIRPLCSQSAGCCVRETNSLPVPINVHSPPETPVVLSVGWSLFGPKCTGLTTRVCLGESNRRSAVLPSRCRQRHWFARLSVGRIGVYFG